MQIAAVLFDWGGTLARIDEELAALTRAAQAVLQLLAGQPSPELVQRLVAAAIEAEKQAAADPELHEVNLGEFLREWLSRHGRTVDDAQLAAALALVGRHWVGAALKVMPEARLTLERLRGMGLRIGLVSNCFIPPQYCWEELRHEGIADLLNSATFSSQVGYRKPSPRIYEQAARSVSDSATAVDYSRILFVGDSPAYDVSGPARLGMKTALVRKSSVAWPTTDYEQAKPDYRIESIAELPGIIANLK